MKAARNVGFNKFLFHKRELKLEKIASSPKIQICRAHKKRREKKSLKLHGSTIFG